MGFFDSLQELPPDPILGLTAAFQAEKHPHKVDLSVGIYRTKELLPEVMPSVRKAEHAVFAKQSLKTYLPIDGDAEFLDGLKKLIVGSSLYDSYKEKIYMAQSLGGTGALRTGADFIKEHVSKIVYISKPTWENHTALFKRAGFEVREYPYFNAENPGVDFEGMKHVLSSAPKGSSVLLHASCHNPTGFDLNTSQWKELSSLMQKHGLFPFFDMAYQGFGKGLSEDAESFRIFLEHGHEMALAYSCSKNFSLYGERIGALALIMHNSKTLKSVSSQVKPIIRTTYSNPPRHGASIVSYILHHEELKTEWQNELHVMRQRISSVRDLFVKELCKKTAKRDFKFLAESNGMFCYCGFTKEQVEMLKKDYGIYTPSTGRVSVCGLNDKNMEYVTNALSEIAER